MISLIILVVDCIDFIDFIDLLRMAQLLLCRAERTQPAFTCLKSTMETPEQRVKPVQS